MKSSVYPHRVLINSSWSPHCLLSISSHINDILTSETFLTLSLSSTKITYLQTSNHSDIVERWNMKDIKENNESFLILEDVWKNYNSMVRNFQFEGSSNNSAMDSNVLIMLIVCEAIDQKPILDFNNTSIYITTYNKVLVIVNL